MQNSSPLDLWALLSVLHSHVLVGWAYLRETYTQLAGPASIPNSQDLKVDRFYILCVCVCVFGGEGAAEAKINNVLTASLSEGSAMAQEKGIISVPLETPKAGI